MLRAAGIRLKKKELKPHVALTPIVWLVRLWLIVYLLLVLFCRLLLILGRY